MLLPPQHSPADPSGEALVMLPDRSTACTGASGQPISTEQPNDQETKPKKKKKKKAKVLVGEEEEDGKNTSVGGEEDIKSEFPVTGSDTGDHGTVEGSLLPQEDKKKRKRKPKDKAEGKEPKTPKAPKTPKTPKEPKEPKEKKVKNLTPKTKTPKKTRYEQNTLE